MNKLLLSAALLLSAGSLRAAEPDYSAWNAILKKHYDARRGMNYRALKAGDLAQLQALRQRLGRVDAAALSKPEQLAYWINVYNVNVVATVAESYPVASIRDLSTDPLIRLNIFKKPLVPYGNGKLSLDAVENEKIREGFRDPRIHFAINCAAASCPPIREEAFTGAAVSRQLDEQATRFLNGPHGVRVTKAGTDVVLHVTKIVDWFGKDFDAWGGGRVAFLRRFLSDDKKKLLDAAHGNVQLEYDDYDWSLNDAGRS